MNEILQVETKTIKIKTNLKNILNSHNEMREQNKKKCYIYQKVEKSHNCIVESIFHFVKH